MPTTRVSDLVEIASRLSRVPKADILGPSRVRAITRIRQAVVFAALSQGVHGLAQIGRFIGRDHTTVIHTRDVVPELMKRDPEYRAFVWQILVEASQESPYVAERKFTFKRAMYQERTRPKPTVKAQEDDEPFYYGGGYSMNREAAL